MKKDSCGLLAIGALSFVTVGGTFLSLTSQGIERGASSFAPGTLTLSNIVSGGPRASRIYRPGEPQQREQELPGGITSGTAELSRRHPPLAVTIANNGSLDASDLSVYMPSCTKVATPGAPTPGGGDPCAANGAQFYVQENELLVSPRSSAGPRGARAPASVHRELAQQHVRQRFLLIGSASASESGPAHNQTRYFIIGLQLPASASNTLQGQAAQFGLTWHSTS